jgi:hypothetical protein
VPAWTWPSQVGPANGGGAWCIGGARNRLQRGIWAGSGRTSERADGRAGAFQWMDGGVVCSNVWWWCGLWRR